MTSACCSSFGIVIVAFVVPHVIVLGERSTRERYTYHCTLYLLFLSRFHKERGREIPVLVHCTITCDCLPLKMHPCVYSRVSRKKKCIMYWLVSHVSSTSSTVNS